MSDSMVDTRDLVVFGLHHHPHCGRAMSTWFSGHPLWIRVQKWFMGAVLAGLAVKLASSKQP